MNKQIITLSALAVIFLSACSTCDNYEPQYAQGAELSAPNYGTPASQGLNVNTPYAVKDNSEAKEDNSQDSTLKPAPAPKTAQKEVVKERVIEREVIVPRAYPYFFYNYYPHHYYPRSRLYFRHPAGFRRPYYYRHHYRPRLGVGIGFGF